MIGFQMNPFDYFLFYFAIHGTVSHPILPPYGFSATPEHEQGKSLYVLLSSTYICTFLPVDSQYIVLPPNADVLVRTMPDIEPAKAPMQSIKYLLAHRLDLHGPVEADHPQPETARIVHWRSTSILHIFLDIWFGMNLTGANRLPSMELLRCMRGLVKQVHTFSNSTDRRDSAAFVALRKKALELLSERFNGFFNLAFPRWPLYDVSLMNLVELWLSFIQPWRYCSPSQEVPKVDRAIESKYEVFIMANIEIYTQTFVKLTNCFISADLSRLINANLLYRLCRVFGQHNLVSLLRQLERDFVDASKRNIPTTALQNEADTSQELTDQQQPAITSFHLGGGEYYVPLFSEETLSNLQTLVRKVRGAMASHTVSKQEPSWFGSRFAWLIALFQPPQQEQSELPNVLCRLEFIEAVLVALFDLPSGGDDPCEEIVMTELKDSMSVSGVGRFPVLAVDWKDPVLLPIRGNENAFLVRFLYTVSSKLQFMYGTEMHALWYNQGLPGMVARQLLMPPCTVHRFARQANGTKELITECLPARISLRFLASYKVLAVIACSLLLGGMLFGAPSYGFFILLLLMLLDKLLTLAVFPRRAFDDHGPFPPRG
ncbi:sphingomyelin phosphodiesterase 4 isoform X2 [Anopheles coustani]|nr:sphingomyelin phosphodiesterase 4 isoform X2 [Anopheles coustani]